MIFLLVWVQHTIYAFITYSQICSIFVFALWKNENKQKEAGFGPFKKSNIELAPGYFLQREGGQCDQMLD